MTREMRRPIHADGRTGTPRYVDRGHFGRKTVFYVVAVFVILLVPLQFAAVALAILFEWIGERMAELRAWSQPCTYSKQANMSTSELTIPPVGSMN